MFIKAGQKCAAREDRPTSCSTELALRSMDRSSILYNIVVINVYKRFFYFSIKNAFLTFFLFFQRFYFKKNVKQLM